MSELDLPATPEDPNSGQQRKWNIIFNKVGIDKWTIKTYSMM
jgi:hypothetical protein